MSAVPLPRPEVKRRNGFTPSPNACLWDWPRLVSGDAQVFSLQYINSETLGAIRDKGTPPPAWSRVITNEELAAFCRCTVRAIEMALSDLIGRTVLERKKIPGKGFAYHIPFDRWPELPDRPSKVVAIDTPTGVEESIDENQDPVVKDATFYDLGDQKLRKDKKTRQTKLPYQPDWATYQADMDGIIIRKSLSNGVLTTHIFASECVEKAKREQEAKSERSGLRVDRAQPSEKAELSNFHLFQNVYLTHGINFAPDDWAGARAVWVRMDIKKRLAAVAGLQARFDQKEYDPADPKWIHKPYNYLEKEIWLATVRPRKAEKVKVFKDETTTVAAHDLAREMDRRKALK